MNLIKKNCITIAFLVISLICKSQTKYPYVIVIDKDSCVVFSISQAKELIKKDEERKYLKEVNDIQIKELSEMNKIVITQQDVIKNKDIIIDEKQKISKEKDGLLVVCEQDKDILNDEIKKQRNGKRIAILTAILIGALGFFF
jgi:hypothetical protein